MNKCALMKAKFQKWCYLKLGFFFTLYFHSHSLKEIHSPIIVVQVMYNYRNKHYCPFHNQEMPPLRHNCTQNGEKLGCYFAFYQLHKKCKHEDLRLLKSPRRNRNKNPTKTTPETTLIKIFHRN